MANLETNLVEVFSSIQGEGILVGVRQLFIRFSGCNLQCQYCDTPGAHLAPAYMRVEFPPASRKFEKLDNPVTVDRLVQEVSRFQSIPHHSLSLTGGEPLLAVEFLQQFLPRLGFPGLVYLETNGTLPDSMERIIGQVDIIAMDIKLPAAVNKDYWAQHREFIRIGSQKNLFVKVVITPETGEDELKKAISLVAATNRQIPMVLQPATPAGEVKGVIKAGRLIELADLALEVLGDVRVVPQTHLGLGLL